MVVIIICFVRCHLVQHFTSTVYILHHYFSKKPSSLIHLSLISLSLFCGTSFFSLHRSFTTKSTIVVNYTIFWTSLKPPTNETTKSHILILKFIHIDSLVSKPLIVVVAMNWVCCVMCVLLKENRFVVLCAWRKVNKFSNFGVQVALCLWGC